MNTRPFLSDETLLDVYPTPPDSLDFAKVRDDDNAEHLRQLRLVADIAVQAYVDNATHQPKVAERREPL